MNPPPDKQRTTGHEPRAVNHEPDADTIEPAPRMLRNGSPMAGLLQRVIGSMDAGGQINESVALAYWPAAAGAQMAAGSEADSVRNGVLIVRTKSSTYSHELTLHKATLLQKLNRMLGGKVIHDIIFRAQGLTRKEAPKPPALPDADDLAAVVLSPDEKAELRARLQGLITIKDDRIRHAIAARVTSEARLRHWRLERGWTLCIRCATAHDTGQPLCPICRLQT